MNAQSFGERINTSDDLERTDLDTNEAVEASDSVTYQGPVSAALVQETPTGGVVVAVEPADEVVVEESPPDGKIPFNVPEGDHPDESEHFRTLWNEIQGKFVEEPRAAVQHADTLVSELIEKITQQFSNEQSSLEQQWKEGKDVSTEDLRKSLLGYRSLFNRLVIER